MTDLPLLSELARHRELVGIQPIAVIDIASPPGSKKNLIQQVGFAVDFEPDIGEQAIVPIALGDI